MLSKRTSRLGLALVLVCSALLSAALAHLAIDQLGDVLLAHDTYDGVEHTSRSALLVFGLAAAVAFAFRQLLGALDLAPAARRRSLDRLRAMVPRRLLPFAVATLAIAVGTLAGMEAFDDALAGVRVDDLGDLFGGSLVLGPLVVLACAAAVSAVVFAALRALVGLTLAVVRAMHLFFVRRSGAADKPLVHRRLARTFALHPQLALRALKRGPPPLSSPAR